ncbi:hypothetical protein [Halococcus saccharolyticus]|uniref:Uncharacterized protein n=1 Tax=Halococcus saccharolyticus DSM 5350 TaxID=1227455 RepID=M0MLB5_9EURY|nr:hypothetical protein [Halococcus saccharolyticus]EMA45504.1 hypothetical protein C449_07785 [Halococcus saccharolyticus DSM 5350]
MELLYAVLSIVLFVIDQLYVGVELLWLIGLIVGLETFVIIVFPVSLYKETVAIRDTGVGWKPNLVLYAALGLAAHGSIIIFGRTGLQLVTVALGVAAVSLYQRRRKTGTP